MPEGFLREILKLEARLEGFLESEEAFVKELKNCIEKMKELNGYIERLKRKSEPKKFEKLTRLRLETIKTLNGALKKESDAEEEKSHLLESYGALILALEEVRSNLELARQ